MAALTFKVGGDVSGLGRSLSKGRGMLNGFAKAAVKVGKTAVFAGITASIAGLTASVAGLKKAIDLGGSLSDLASRTGIAVRELVILKQAFEDNGLSGEKVGTTINKLQKSISDAGNGLATPLRALKAMGLAFEDLEGKSPLEQFEMIQEALAGMEDHTMKAGAAMDLFGRSGGELLTLFADQGAVGKATETVGEQAEILERNAKVFDRSSDLLKSIWSKFTGFFVGMAEFVNPVLLPVLEELNKLDFAKQGQMIGRSVRMIAEAFKSGSIPKLMADGLIVAGQELLNFLVKGFRGLVAGLIENLKSIPKVFVAAIKTLADPELWKGLGNILVGLGKKMSLAFLELIPAQLREGAGMADDGFLKSRQIFASGDILKGKAQIERSAARGLMNELGDAAGRFGAAFRKEMEGAGPIDTSKRRGDMEAVIRGLGEAVDAQKSAAEEQKNVAAAAAQGEAGGFGGLRVMKPIVSSLAKVGGAMGAGVIRVDLDRERNGLLKRIEKNTRGMDFRARWA